MLAFRALLLEDVFGVRSLRSLRSLRSPRSPWSFCLPREPRSFKASPGTFAALVTPRLCWPYIIASPGAKRLSPRLSRGPMDSELASARWANWASLFASESTELFLLSGLGSFSGWLFKLCMEEVLSVPSAWPFKLCMDEILAEILAESSLSIFE